MTYFEALSHGPLPGTYKKCCRESPLGVQMCRRSTRGKYCPPAKTPLSYGTEPLSYLGRSSKSCSKGHEQNPIANERRIQEKYPALVECRKLSHIQNLELISQVYCCWKKAGNPIQGKTHQRFKAEGQGFHGEEGHRCQESPTPETHAHRASLRLRQEHSKENTSRGSKQVSCKTE